MESGSNSTALESPPACARIRCDPDSLFYMQAPTPDGAKAVFQQTQKELSEYFYGERTEFDVPLEVEGTEFQKKVWRALRDIPYGQSVSYTDVARTAGLTAHHGRPVGTAVGRNPISIIIPCHRVLSSAGALAGYTGGLERKFALLKLEGFSLA
ncbi:methylated-DNA--[protein]-cysteine S-methyltransferase [Alcaligenaceae bacterium]|nr:methylated-DNA--[protein]-cysteine S-methyltransferase [Alcaligenaceae bacterium]